MSEPKLMIAARKKNGQIGYISEGYSLPEFFSFIRPQNNISMMVDYSPVIDILYELHKNSGDTKLLADYTNLNNYWREAKSFKRESVRMTKAEEISRMSSGLIAKLQTEINRKGRSFYNITIDQAQTIVSEITSECNIYIDTLLYYIHSKATLEIESFTRDNVIAEHGNFVYGYINKKYKELLNWGSDGDDFLTYVVFERPDDAVHFLELTEGEATVESHKLKVIDRSKPEKQWSDFNQGYEMVASIKYPLFSDQYVNILTKLRDLLFKSRSINLLIERLRSGEIEWDEAGSHAQAIADEIVTINNTSRLRLS